MFSLGTLIITGLLCSMIGVALGATAFKLFTGRSNVRELEQRLHRSEDELKKYQQDVTQHFAQTSELVNNLTRSYRDVYEHLANSALKLTTPGLSRQILKSANTELLDDEKTYISEEKYQVPRDWAPKKGAGALSEDYGLHEEHDEHADPTEPKDPQAASHSTQAERSQP